jgi:hypothetical protein
MPDIHWHVGDDAERETIARTTEPRRSRRSWIAILIIVVLGAGLGMAYRSIPEPAPRPTPTPSPSPTPQPTPVHPAMPAKLFAAIDGEAQALADGDVETVIALHTRQNDLITKWQRQNFVAWGRPTDETPLYTIIDFNLRTQAQAWADVRQFRDGRSFRETRFYRWEKDRWLRSEADPFFWDLQVEALDTPHFHASYFVEDRDLAQPIIQALEEAYPQVCRDLGCTEAAATLTYTLKLDGTSEGGLRLSGDARELTFTSPRLTGVFEDKSLDSRYLIWGITVATVQRVYYDAATQWNGDSTGHIVFNAIINWAMQQMPTAPDIHPLFAAPLNAQELVPLTDLWGKAYETDSAIVYPEAYAVIRFIVQEYGKQAIPKLLKALGTAQSFADVVETSLGVPFTEFDQKWQAWVKTNFAAP